MTTIPNDPIFVISEPVDHAENFKLRLLRLGCSEPYAEAARLDVLARTVQISGPSGGNAILCGIFREQQARREL